MVDFKIPASVSDLSVKLLNQILQNYSQWQFGDFESIEVTIPHGALDGMSNAVHRIDGSLVSGGSKTLVIKLKDAGGSPRARQGDEHEVIFYRDLADIAGVESPIAYAAEYDKSSHRSLILLEHLGESGIIGTTRSYLGVPQVERIVEALARMHAKWWNSSELASLTNVRTFEDAFGEGAKLFASGHFSGTRFIDRYGEHLHPDIFAMYKSSQTWGMRLQDGFSSHRTLCNYDVAAKNLFLPHDPTLSPKFFDWSLLTRGSIGIELTVVLAYSLRIDDHDSFERILKTYLDSMNEYGVTDLSWETLWDDFRFGLLTRLAAPIALTSRDYQPAHDLALELLPRITSAALKSGAIDLLDRR